MNMLSATDFLPKSEAAIERAAFLADLLKAELTVVHAVAPAAPDGHTLDERVRNARSRLATRTAAARLALELEAGYCTCSSGVLPAWSLIRPIAGARASWCWDRIATTHFRTRSVEPSPRECLAPPCARC